MNMDTEQQEQLETRQERSEEEKNRLLETYKLHAQLASDISNRQNTTSRFYATLISALLVIFFTFLQNKDKLLLGDPEGKIALGYSLLIVGFLGILLSLIWVYSINHHVLMSIRKYAILMELESELDFQFLREEWTLGEERTDIENADLVYTSFPKAEKKIPYAFLVLFGLLTLIGIWIEFERLISQLLPLFA